MKVKRPRALLLASSLAIGLMIGSGATVASAAYSQSSTKTLVTAMYAYKDYARTVVASTGKKGWASTYIASTSNPMAPGSGGVSSRLYKDLGPANPAPLIASTGYVYNSTTYSSNVYFGSSTSPWTGPGVSIFSRGTVRGWNTQAYEAQTTYTAPSMTILN